MHLCQKIMALQFLIDGLQQDIESIGGSFGNEWRKGNF